MTAKLTFHLLAEEGDEIQHSVEFTGSFAEKTSKEVTLNEWFKMGDIACLVEKIIIGQDGIELHLRPINRKSLQ